MPQPAAVSAAAPAATEVALRTADLCYIPYQPTESDHDRATEAVSVCLLLLCQPVGG